MFFFFWETYTDIHMYLIVVYLFIFFLCIYIWMIVSFVSLLFSNL